ncbi:MAG TPA: dockerin type I repeat-containing protein, partial [Longimicrobiales bacterium]|nr:dockerin type I repeat-containing protein [Longimicrobiales bacterium]
MRRLGLTMASALLLAGPAAGAPLPGDLDGDGAVGSSDEALLAGLYGSASGDPDYDSGADLDADGAIDVTDLARFGADFGATGGDVDTTPPTLFVTLNGIPDDMNDLLVVPPTGFRITIAFDGTGGSILDPGSFAITNSEDLSWATAGTSFSGLFQVSQSGAEFEIPASDDFPLANHYLDVSVRDAAGNEATAIYGFAVRRFAFGAPLGNPQVMFLDFDQDRSLGTEVDFLEDLREYGLSSTADPVLESSVRDALVVEIAGRVNEYYGLAFDGTPGPDGVNISFTATAPAVAHSRLCVGGESSLGGAYLGSSILDVHNLNETQDDCGTGTQYGVFPQALDDLWSGNAEYQTVFGPVDPDLGGTPVGEDPLDATVLDPDFDPSTATAEELDRLAEITNALDAFAQVLASAIAHETGHYLGLTAPGPAPAGLYGGESGGSQDHNVTPSGGTPSENLLMNAGASFTFDAM